MFRSCGENCGSTWRILELSGEIDKIWHIAKQTQLNRNAIREGGHKWPNNENLKTTEQFKK